MSPAGPAGAEEAPGEALVARAPRPAARGATIWFTGLSGAGKSSVARALMALLRERGARAVEIDGDEIRQGLNADLGFSEEDRLENVRRIGEVARLFALTGHLAVVAVISPYAEGRKRTRARNEESGLDFVEIYMATPLEVCEKRDVKGLYARARRGEISSFTGVSDPYQPPEAPEVELMGYGRTARELAHEVLAVLEARGLV